MTYIIDYALELFDTDRDDKAVRYRLMRDLKMTREQAEDIMQKAIDLRQKRLHQKQAL